MKPFGSPTLSDQALMHFPSFKLVLANLPAPILPMNLSK